MIRKKESPGTERRGLNNSLVNNTQNNSKHEPTGSTPDQTPAIIPVQRFRIEHIATIRELAEAITSAGVTCAAGAEATRDLVRFLRAWRAFSAAVLADEEFHHELAQLLGAWNVLIPRLAAKEIQLHWFGGR